MAGTAELDRLLEELKLTSMNMASGLPPPSGKVTTQPVGGYGTPQRNIFATGIQSPPLRNQSYTSESRYRSSTMTSTNRASSAMGLYGGSLVDGGMRTRSPHTGAHVFNTHSAGTPAPTSTTAPPPHHHYGYQRQSSFTSDRRGNGTGTMYTAYPSYLRSGYSPIPTQRHQTTYTTVLASRPPAAPSRQFSQVHLTIDPECGMTETIGATCSQQQQQQPHSITNNDHHHHHQQHQSRDVGRREQRLESELASVRQELAQYRRAMSLVQERQRYASHSELHHASNSTTDHLLHQQQQHQPAQLASTSQSSTAKTPSFLTQLQERRQQQQQQQQQHQGYFLSSSSQYGRQNNSWTYQRNYPRAESQHSSLLSSGQPRRTMSHTNVYNPRSWSLRSNQASDNVMTSRRVSSVSNAPPRSNYSAHRERLRQEKEQEMWRRQHMLAASTTGLNDAQQFGQKSRSQQQYRSMTAVDQAGAAEAFQEIETIILQPIGRGIHDIDSRVGSMTTLSRGPGGSLAEGLHRTEDGLHYPRNNIQRNYASTQYLNRDTSNLDINRSGGMHSSTMMNMPGAIAPHHQTNSYHQPPAQQMGPPTNLMQSNHYGSRSQISVADSATLVGGAPPPPPAPPPQSQPTSPSPWQQPNNQKGVVTGTVDLGDPSVDITGIQGPVPSWYRPKLTRVEAIRILRELPPGSFLVRHSLTYTGIFVLAVKLATLPPKVTQKTQDLQSELVRHYLIDVVTYPTKGVRIKGFPSEPIFPTLTALIHEHTVSPLALPCQLILPPTSMPTSPVGNAVGPQIVTVQNGTTMAAAPSPVVLVQHNGVASEARPSVVDGVTAFRCFMLGSIDTPQWDDDICFARSVDKLIPRDQLTATECDHGVSPVLYTEAQLHVSAHDGITIIDLQKRSFLRRHLPNQVLKYCGLETRGKEFLHPTHQIQGIDHPRIFGIVVRKGISECTTHVFSECDPQNSAETIVRHILSTYPHLSIR